MSDVEVRAVEEALGRLFGANSDMRRHAATELVAAARLARTLVSQSTLIPSAEGEQEVCTCPVCGRTHWRRGG